ncbi:Pycsar system effector family protein [Streptomyces sp. NPDC057620]|uniref:Pycsar system effector family protein n=1 Tax=Streptomyces sp. NPDC057620 TaxID=3346185 RepID=UPI003692725D
MALPALIVPDYSSTHTDHNLAEACAFVSGEIARTDGKSSLLLAFTGAVLAGLASLTGRSLPTVTQAFGAAGVLALTAASILLLLVVRPRLRGGGPESFPAWARMSEDDIREALHGDLRAARMRILSRIAVRKFRRLQRAVDLILTALALLLIAAIGVLL